MLYRSLRSLSGFLFLAVFFFVFFCCAATAQQQTMVVQSELRHDVSPPLGDLMKKPAPVGAHPEEDEMLVIPHPSGFKPADVPDPVLQPSPSAGGVPPGPAISAGPTLLLNFEGVDQCSPAFGCAPPDTEGAVGLTQYVQWVNLQFAVFKKSDGTLLAGPSAGNTIWSGFPGDCSTSNDGDPIVVYDKLADRWVFTQFVLHNLAGPFSQCVAVSTTSDALGTYNRYQFGPYTDINDYPKMGVWPDAYYITYNMFSKSSFGFLGTLACAFDRNAMLNGQAATQVCFQQQPTVGGVLPADIDGHTPPAAGTPNYLMEFDVNSLNLYKFHVDFATPSNSTFTLGANIPVAPFTPFCPAVRGCVPQQGTTNTLDSLGDRLMYRLAYRNFGDHESLVVNHSVAVTVNGNSTSGVRWYEIQNPGAATPTVAQQSTWAPDANFRWMGSVAMDQAGDLAVGYSVSSSTMFPAIFIAARTASDPPSTLQPEISVMAGTGSQTNGPTRWGDYSAMQVDPVDDCTFWYTTEYVKTTGSFNWNTRINSFKFDSCDKPDMTVVVSHTGNFTQGDTTKTYTITATNSGGKPTDGSTVTVTDTVPAGLTINANAASGTGWTCSQATNTVTCTRSDVLAAKTSYPDITLTVDVSSSAPGFVTDTATVAGGGEQNTSNDTSNDVTTIIQTGPDPTITKTHSGTFIQGQTGTYTITVTNAGLTTLDGTTVTVTDTLPTGLTANAASGTGWTCVLGPPVSCTRTDTLASNVSYPPITLTVNIANNAPLKVTNTATVAGGGDVNTLNDTANDPTTIIPPPPDLSITKTHSGNFNQGQSSASYTLTVSNASGATATSGTVTVTDSIPTGLSGSFAFGFPWNCFTTSTNLTCTRTDSLLGGNSYNPITLFVNVDKDAPASVDNTATVSGGGDVTPGNNTATDHTIINPSPDLTITKSHTPDPFIVGMTGTYTITVSNVGHADTSGTVIVTDFLPIGLTATTISGTGWSCSATPTTFVSCTRADALSAGSSYPAITVTVSVTGGGPGVTNSASVSGGGEFNFSNDSASDLTNITAPILAITKSHTGNFTVGQNGTYTIAVSNIGPIATIGTTVTVTDSLPLGLTATAASGTGWSCSGLPSTFLSCTRSDVLAVNGSYPALSVTVAVDGSASATVSNTASVTGGGDTNFHSFTDITNINVPDLAISKTHTGNFVVGQQGATYTITVSNVGTIATAGGTVIVQDFMPFGLTATAASGTGWSCSVGSGFFVTCSQPAGNLAPGSSYPPITLTVNVTLFNPGTITNTVSVSGIGDANPGNNSSSNTTQIVLPVSITPSGSTAVTVTAGSPAAYTFTATLVSSPPVGTVSFNLGGALPQNTKVTFSPTSVTQTGPVTLTIDTSGNGHVASAAPVGLAPGRIGVVVAALLFPVLLWTTRRKISDGRRRAKWLGAGMGISVLVLLAALSGCGGHSSPPPPPPVTTPPGIYPMTVTATSSVAGVPSTTMSITLTVR